MNMLLGDKQLIRDTIKVSLTAKMCATKKPALWREKNWILHHDNALAHSALSIREFFAKFRIFVLLKSPYTRDLTPANFYLFPKLKILLKGKQFDLTEDIQANTNMVLNIFKKENFHEYFQKWEHHWSLCIQSEGDYFEGDYHKYVLQF